MKKCLKVFFAVFISSIIYSTGVSAVSRTSWGARDVSYYATGGGTGYHRTLSGATWYYYQISGDGYGENETVAVPFNSNYDTKVAVPVKTCKEYGGFWVLLRNEYQMNGDSQDGTRVEKLTDRPAIPVDLNEISTSSAPEGISWTPTDYILYKDRATGEVKDANGNSTIEITKTGTMKEVLDEFKSLANTTAIPDGATLSSGNFSYFCAGPNRPRTEEFTTFSNVSTSEYYASAPVREGTSYLGRRQDSDGNINTSLLVPEGSKMTLTFNHYLAKKSPAGDFKDGSAVEIESITRSINGGAAETVAPSENPLTLGSMKTDRIRVDDIDYYVANSSQSFDQEITAEITICETINFKKASYSTALKTNNEVGVQSGTISSTACISIRPVPSTGTSLVTDCEQGGNAQYAGREPYPGIFGNNVATVGVTLNGNLSMTTAGAHSSQADPLLEKKFYEGSTVTVYGKPGDVVQFSYALCFGAPISGAFPGANWAAPNIENRTVGATFGVGIGSSGTDRQPQFLFGRATGVLGQASIEVNNTKIRDTASFNHTAFVYDNDVNNTMTAEEATYLDITHDGNDKPQIIFASPDSKQKTVPADLTENEEGEATGQYNGDYSCLFYDGLNSATAKGVTQGGYQISGIQQNAGVDYDCASANLMRYDGTSEAGSGSVVGASISQTLTYAFTAAWPATINGKSYVGLNAPNRSSVMGDYDNGGIHTQIDDIAETAELYEAAYNAYAASGGTASVSQARAFHTVNDPNSSIGKISKTATVVIPYNFETDLSLKINNDSPTVEAGEEISLSANVDILPRINPLTSDATKNDDGTTTYVPYATITPPDTKVQIIELLVADDAKLDNKVSDDQTVKDILDGNITYDRADICNRLIKVLGSNLGEDACWARTVKGYKAETVSSLPDGGKDPKGGTELGNNLSDPAGEMGYYNDSDIKRKVPDAETGYKYCVAIGINHGDSHGVSGQLSVYPYLDVNGSETDEINSGQLDDEGNPIKNRENPRFGANSYSVNGNLTTEAPHNWKVSGFSCRSIIKKPNFTVWNGGVYSGGNIDASITKKAPNTRFAEKKSPEEKVFGSWAEYFIVSKGSVAGMSSASGLGFSSQYTWVENDDEGNQHYFTGFQPHYWISGVKYNGRNEYWLSGIASGLKASVYSPCVVSHLTIANENCENGSLGGNYASGDTDNAALESYKQRILNYYTDKEAEATVTGNENKLSGLRVDDGTFEFDEKDEEPLQSLSGAKYLKVNGNIDLDVPIHQSNGVLVINATGHININENICLGSDGGLCLKNVDTRYLNNWDDIVARFGAPAGDEASYAQFVYDQLQDINNTSLERRNSTSFSGSNLDIPQVIIIAESISISANVSQIDAWIVTSSDKSYKEEFSGGYVNTCKEFKDGETGADDCWKTLKINGPVVTSALFLNRTGGAWAGLTGDVGNRVYDILRIVYEHYSETWKNQSTGRCDKDCQTKKQTFFEALGQSNQAAAYRAYKAINYYSSDKNAIASGRTNSRDLACDGSITPAEIFDLHPIVYYWAVAEAQKGNQAIVTYAQEFAPRY